jgi:hypothetical protein
MRQADSTDTTDPHSCPRPPPQYDYSLEAWRQYKGSRCDFSLLDRNKGAAWDLATRLITKRDKYFRGRLSVGGALRHRFFLPEF